MLVISFRAEDAVVFLLALKRANGSPDCQSCAKRKFFRAFFLWGGISEESADGYGCTLVSFESPLSVIDSPGTWAYTYSYRYIQEKVLHGAVTFYTISSGA